MSDPLTRLTRMLRLRADPWMPDFGMGFQVRVDEAPAASDPDVETTDWTRPIPSVREGPDTVWFVDGVRRVELRLLADHEGRRAPGLFGSHAVGGVRCGDRARCMEERVGRAVVLGGGLRPERVEVRAGGASLCFEPSTHTGDDPDGPLWRLQQLMREAEGALAAFLAGGDDALVLVDGPLTFPDPTRVPVVGLVKRFARNYLDREHDALLARLAPGERTPLFGLGIPDQPVDRYAWYTRIAPMRIPWHDHAGVVRCEVRAALGLDEGIRLAGVVTALLPAYAGRPSDPRAPQNLAPVGSLETWLRHRMGHPRMVRRALSGWLSEQEAAA